MLIRNTNLQPPHPNSTNTFTFTQKEHVLRLWKLTARPWKIMVASFLLGASDFSRENSLLNFGGGNNSQVVLSQKIFYGRNPAPPGKFNTL